MQQQAEGQRTQGSFMRSFTYDAITGQTFQNIKQPYRWTLRHMREVDNVAVVEIDTRGALVYVQLNDGYTVLCHAFGSYMLAKQRYGQWADEHGFSYITYDYPEEYR